MTVTALDGQDLNRLHYLHVHMTAVQLNHFTSTAFYLGYVLKSELNFAPVFKDTLGLFQLHNPQSNPSPM